MPEAIAIIIVLVIMFDGIFTDLTWKNDDKDRDESRQEK